ncbi:MAG: HAD family hydrolase, partial [Phycisphaerae bacterium]
PKEPILEMLPHLPAHERARIEAILHRYESGFAETSELQPGAARAVAGVRERGFACALMTRNSRASVGRFLQRHGLGFDLTWTREDGPMKPSPEPVHIICERLGAQPARTWVIGDYLYDIQCGRDAGARTVLVLNNDHRPAWADQADHVITCLDELSAILDEV